MRDLSTYFECCDAATPGTVMGMGNPAAPEGDTVGSGDTFRNQKRKKKVKPGAEKQEWPNDIGRGKTDEGLLDMDFGLDDSSFGLSLDDLLEQFADIFREDERPTEHDYESFYEGFKACIRELATKSGITDSVMKACRGSKYTVISFWKKGLMGNSWLSYENVIEVRKFIHKPRPSAIALGWSSIGVQKRMYDVNHPTAGHMRHAEWFIVPGDIWDKLEALISGHR